MENIAILGLRDKLAEVNEGINECTNKKGGSMKTLLHIKNELDKAIIILKACEVEMSKEGFGQLTIPVVVFSEARAEVCPKDCINKKRNVNKYVCDTCIQFAHFRQT